MLFTEKNIANEDIKKWSPSYDDFFMKRGGGGGFSSNCNTNRGPSVNCRAWKVALLRTADATIRAGSQ